MITRRSFASDLSDQEWQQVAPSLPQPNQSGRPLGLTQRELLKAMLYVAATSCGWRQLPDEFGPWQTVYYHYHQWKLKGIWNRVYQSLNSQSLGEVVIDYE